MAVTFAAPVKGANLLLAQQALRELNEYVRSAKSGPIGLTLRRWVKSGQGIEAVGGDYATWLQTLLLFASSKRSSPLSTEDVLEFCTREEFDRSRSRYLRRRQLS